MIDHLRTVDIETFTTKLTINAFFKKGINFFQVSYMQLSFYANGPNKPN